MEEKKCKFGIDIKRCGFTDSDWSFGICLSHTKWENDSETYVFINIFKWSITIGKFLK